MANLDPVVGHEQAGTRPVLVISVDEMNRSRSACSIVVPFTTRDRGLPLHVRVKPPEGGLAKPSVALVDRVQTASHERFGRRLGRVHDATLAEIARRVRLLTRARP